MSDIIDRIDKVLPGIVPLATISSEVRNLLRELNYPKALLSAENVVNFLESKKKELSNEPGTSTCRGIVS